MNDNKNKKHKNIPGVNESAPEGLTIPACSASDHIKVHIVQGANDLTVFFILIFYSNERTVPNTIEKWQNQMQSNNTNTSMYT
jgi:hypothetical protein